MSLFRRYGAFWLVLLPLIVPGLLVTAWRCLFRNIAEQQNFFVETVVDFEDIRQLAREEGWLLNQLFTELKKNGASSIAISEDTLASLESEGKITVMSSKEIRKLAIDEGLEIKLPMGKTTLGALWVHSEDSNLLDRIEENLSWKIPDDKLIKIHRHLLLINKSSKGFMEQVGLGFSLEYFQMAQNAGLGTVVRMFNYPGLTSKNAAKIINSIPSPASVSALLFSEEMLGARGELEKIIDLFKNRSYRIGRIEFDTQDGITDYIKNLSDSRPFVRVHSISRREIDENYNVKRAIARWVRAVKDRSMKMLYIRCFFQDEKKFIENLVNFNLKYVKQIFNNLTHAGFKIADNNEERLNEPRHLMGKMSIYEILSIGIALMMGLAILARVSIGKGIREKWCFIIFALTVALFALVPIRIFTAITGLTGAISYSTIGVILAMKQLKKSNSFFTTIPGFLLRSVLPSVFGGLLIAGIHSETEYLLKYEQFRGVKLAFILPLIISGLWALKSYGKGVFSLLHKPLNPIGVILISAVIAGTTLYLLRSGNITFLKPSILEDEFRTFLENTLGARPRNKEFLVGYPAALLFIFFYIRQNFLLLPILAVFMQMGQVSVINSLCHFHTPLNISLLRIFNGLWTGVIVGLVVVFIAWIIRLLMILGAEKKREILLIGYFGYGNYGDEFLRETFIDHILNDLKNYKITSLNRISKNNTDKIDYISRMDIFKLIEHLFSCHALVIPGGGIFQSSTSLRSLFYYTILISIARIAGAKILLPSQGLGPFKKIGWVSRYLNRWLAYELKKANYLSIRDATSGNEFFNLTNIEKPPHVYADMAFLYEKPMFSKPFNKDEKLKVCVILRSSIINADKIATELISMQEDMENLELCPVAFQPVEDEKVWHKAGWQGEIITGDEFEENLKDTGIVISMRLHACILSTIASVPWIAVNYDPKVKAFADSVHWEAIFEPESVNKTTLEKHINELISRHTKLSDRLSHATSEKRLLAIKDYEALKKEL